ncbi:hypothetical protein [Pseudonocardia xishanensis]
MPATADDDRIRELPSSCALGRIGCRDGDEVYGVPISDVDVDGAIHGVA